MYFVIDRLEEHLAVLEFEDGSHVSLSRALFPQAREGDVYRFCPDPEEQARRAQTVSEITKKMFEG